ncbi:MULTISPECIES: conjugal transfer protein TraE [Serratia]|nr:MULTISPECIES: conjugal transfer protein TraE [Serratia]
MMHSLSKLVQALIAFGNKTAQAQSKEMDDGRKEITSIRLKPQTRAYLQVQSENLGISVSQLINIMVDGVVSVETTPQKNVIDTMYDRLMMLFESHNLTPLEISRLLKHRGVTLSKLKSRDALLDLITPEMLAEISEWFGVRLTWLNGRGDEIYENNSLTWYKNTEQMAVSLIQRRIEHGKLDIYVIKRAGVSFAAAEEHDDHKHNLRMGFLLKYRHKVGDVEFEKYELCEFQRWNYNRCREQLKLVFKFINELAQRTTGVYMHGVTVDDNHMEKISLGRVFPSQVKNEFSKQGEWYPEEHTEDNLSGYSNKKFRQYIDTYCGNPSKSFIKKRDANNNHIWEVKVWGDNQETQEYLYLRKALEDTYEKYPPPAKR